MDVLESIKHKMRIKPTLNKPEDVFVYIQHKKEPEYVVRDDYNSDDVNVNVIVEDEDYKHDKYVLVEPDNSNTKAPVIMDETTLHQFDIQDFLSKLRENELLQVIPNEQISAKQVKPKKKKTKHSPKKEEKAEYDKKKKKKHSPEKEEKAEYDLLNCHYYCNGKNI